MTAPVLRAERLTRRHGQRAVVAGASLALAPGEWVALMGPSGCGKTSLLFLLGLLDRPGEGRVLLDGADAWAAGRAARTRLRGERLGLVFQQGNLLDGLTARENVVVPAWRRSGDRRAAGLRADALLERLGLAACAGRRAGLLSGGEAQRVALARALVNGPAVILADEPTGSLDSASAGAVLETLAAARESGAALLVATHDARTAARADRVLSMMDGRLASPSPEDP